MTNGTDVIVLKDTTANPAPLGLLAFGMTTILLNLHNAGLFGMNTVILAMGIFVGGMAQVIVGKMEWKKNNTFGTVAFTAYGFFWITLVGIIVMPKLGMGEAPDALSMACFLIVWGIFSTFMFIGTFRLSKALQVVFGSLVILFFLLAIGKLTGDPTIEMIAGIEGIFCGASAFYTAMAQILNEIYGTVVMPLGPVKKP